MHILEIPSFFPPSGGLFCLDQAKALASLGHTVRILSNVQLGITIGAKNYISLPLGRYEHVMDGITVYQSYQRGIPKAIRYNVNHWIEIVCSMYQNYEKKYGRPDILHAHCAKWAGYAAMIIGKKYGIPYVITEHQSRLIFEEEFGPAPSKAWQIPLLKEAYHNASKVIPVSEELVDNISCYFGMDYQWQSISNTIDTDFYTYRKREPLVGRKFCFCCLANFWPLKGYDVLFKAFEQLRHERADVVLHIAGRGTDSAACRSQLPEGVIAHGLLDKESVRTLLYQSDALVLASRSEVQPLVLLEAMSTGIPVVSTECIPKCLRIEGGCTIVPIGDAQALADAMQSVMHQPSIDGRQLSERVAAMASPKVVAKQLEAVFETILKGH
ncbi:MAG: glycosyltransferase [Prevotella sp.]|nr:glycosyltransferase [Prevotella sp.]